MKIYMLEISEVASTRGLSMTSSFVSPRQLRSIEYYVTKDKADARHKEIYEGLSKLIGFIPDVDVVISEVEVIE